MKTARISILVLLVAVLTIPGCGMDQASVRDSNMDKLEANKKTVRYIFETVWNDADFSSLESVLATEVRFHFRGTAILHAEDLRAEVTKWHEAFPDFRFAVEDLVAEGDLVAIRLRFTGTHTGTPWWGLPASGKEINVSEMMFFRLQDGKIVEAWEEYDEYLMRKQLDLPAPGE